MSVEERVSATRTIKARPAEIWAVITDPAGHVAIDASGMLMTADGARAVGQVGDQFVIHMDREALGDIPLGQYTVTNTVTAYEPQLHFQWSVGGLGMEAVGHLYGYELQPDGDGSTIVTSYCDWSGIPEDWKSSGFFPVIPATTLRATLGILEREVQARRAG